MRCDMIAHDAALLGIDIVPEARHLEDETDNGIGQPFSNPLLSLEDLFISASADYQCAYEVTYSSKGSLY